MDCKYVYCVLVIYILLEVMKTRFSREKFTRKNNNLNTILQDGDGNIKTMPLKDIYDAIQQAKTSSNGHTNNIANTKESKLNKSQRCRVVKSAQMNLNKDSHNFRFAEDAHNKHVGCHWNEYMTSFGILNEGHYHANWHRVKTGMKYQITCCKLPWA